MESDETEQRERDEEDEAAAEAEPCNHRHMRLDYKGENYCLDCGTFVRVGNAEIDSVADPRSNIERY